MPERTTRISVGLPSITAPGALHATRIIVTAIAYDESEKAMGAPVKLESEPVTTARVAFFDVPIPAKCARIDLIAICAGDGDTVPVPLMASIKTDEAEPRRLSTTRGKVPIVLSEPGFIDLMPSEPTRAVRRAAPKADRITAGQKVKTPDGDGKVVEIRPGEKGADGRALAVLTVSVGGKMRQYSPDQVSIMQAAS